MNIPETLKMPTLCVLAKRPQGILRNQSTRGFFGFESSFQICFWNVFSTSGLSENCKTVKCLEASKSVDKEYSDPMLCKIFLEFKNIILEVIQKTQK
jgi:hypothetical protein